MRSFTTVSLLASTVGTSAFTTSTPAFRTQTSLSADLSRSNFLKNVVGAVGVASITTMVPSFAFADGEEIKLPSGTTYSIVKSGDGPQGVVGELAGIRFKAEVKQSGNKIDDIFDTPEPYYTRVGAGGLIKGVEEVLVKMRVGDRYIITAPTNMAFGSKGRPASAGKPRIPGDAIIIFEVEMVSLPGRETELIDLIGDD
mmetsp:Transcript_4325/g.4069  ORF Transcript_4325/g.4069 Transcript_4325/m.4069 type:complete len:199 (-) Transcript_4325:145-741(-)